MKSGLLFFSKIGKQLRRGELEPSTEPSTEPSVFTSNNSNNLISWFSHRACVVFMVDIGDVVFSCIAIIGGVFESEEGVDFFYWLGIGAVDGYCESLLFPDSIGVGYVEYVIVKVNMYIWVDFFNKVNHIRDVFKKVNDDQVC